MEIIQKIPAVRITQLRRPSGFQCLWEELCWKRASEAVLLEELENPLWSRTGTTENSYSHRIRRSDNSPFFRFATSVYNRGNLRNKVGLDKALAIPIVSQRGAAATRDRSRRKISVFPWKRARNKGCKYPLSMQVKYYSAGLFGKRIPRRLERCRISYGRVYTFFSSEDSVSLLVFHRAPSLGVTAKGQPFCHRHRFEAMSR